MEWKARGHSRRRGDLRAHRRSGLLHRFPDQSARSPRHRGPVLHRPRRSNSGAAEADSAAGRPPGGPCTAVLDSGRCDRQASPRVDRRRSGDDDLHRRRPLRHLRGGGGSATRRAHHAVHRGDHSRVGRSSRRQPVRRGGGRSDRGIRPRRVGERGPRTSGLCLGARPSTGRRILEHGARRTGRAEPRHRPSRTRTFGAGRHDAALPRLLASVHTRPALVGHSLGCGPVLRYAAEHPERISGVVLVAPAFLQPRAGMLLRSPLMTPALRRISATALAKRLGVPESAAIASAAANLRRPGVAARTLGALRRASASTQRAELRALLDRVEVPVRIVTGATDPITIPTSSESISIEGTGHYPQLTHPQRLAAELVQMSTVGARN
ncbi:alpha/beta fold hydrolase [Nocardia gipuzkoensis]|uniref:alpha/beta fold hydrolase n=1 Tax=Nocardia gipuzkoensis TaxID=2749991 RepID=UPI003EE1B843